MGFQAGVAGHQTWHSRTNYGCQSTDAPLWSVTKKMCMTINLRARTDPWFSDFLLRVGDETEESIEGTFIRIQDDMTVPYIDKKKSVRFYQSCISCDSRKRTAFGLHNQQRNVIHQK